MPLRVGFIVGKDTDVVEDPKYEALGGDASFLKDMPRDFRVDPESHEFLRDCAPEVEGQAHCDVALAWWIHKNCPDIQVDIIAPPDITMERLRSNAFNFSMGYNGVNVSVENNANSAKILKTLKSCGNIVPSWEVEEYILYKSRYMQACMNAGVPMAPTLFAFKDKRSPAQLLKQIKARGWKTFVLKQSTSGFSLGFKKLKVEDCENDPRILKDYFKEWEHIPEYIVQEAIEGFTRNWETRCFWWNGEFLYAIANMAAVSTEDGQERIVTGDDIPEEFLENAKRIGREAVRCLPPLRAPGGGEVPMVLMRTDIGCSDSQVYDVNTKWDPDQKTFFLNEIEPNSTTYFVRHLKFDCIPMYGKLYADLARRVGQEMANALPRALPLKGSGTSSKAVGSAKRSSAKKPMRSMKTTKTAMRSSAAMKKSKGKKGETKAMKQAKKSTKAKAKTKSKKSKPAMRKAK
eukprot:TRINITY_DN37469_c0_g1_i1.p1 TRINITY_DN37469_c0_g1~~TRINITY_DN37469_c0_g1_i1.p1  ORF type:complete len:481 (-),score=120.95 TRINITY_DN37469_c0_g1_i1:279-1661(-)